MDEKVFGRPSASGVRVSTDTAANFSAWFNGCQQISQTIASLPLIVYKKENKSKRHYTELPLYNVLRRKVNVRTDAFRWKEVSFYHQLSWGGSYSYIQRDFGMRPVGLWLLNPECMKKIFVMEDGTLQYEYQDPKRGKIIYRQDEILYIPGFGFDGIRGYSILTLARETIGLGLTQEEFLARFYGKGTHPGGFLEHPGTISPKAKENLISSFEKEYAGTANVGKVILLEEGMKYNKTIMPLVDAQFLESRTFSIQEVARWLNMPPHKLKDLSHATYSNIEQEQSSYYQDTIRPHLERNEASMDMQLLTGADEDNAYIEYNFKAILRADVKTRNEVYHMQRMDGVISADEWRDEEDMNPTGEEHGKAYILPQNMMNAERILDKPKEPEPPPAMEADPGDDIDNEGAKE